MDNKNSNEKNFASAGRSGKAAAKKIFFVLYITSFIPYLFLVYSCIFGIEFGFFSNVSTYYGFEALLIAGIAGCLIPVYPISLLYQIIYTAIRYKHFSAKFKKLIICILVSLAALIIIPS